MSLLEAKGSNGMGRAVDAGPDMVAARKEICTSAEVALVKTRGLCLMTVPEARSKVAMSLEIVAGTSRE